jgi:biopolymer transport protein ExbD
MRVPTHHDDRWKADIAMTPMIDVVFLLMIFFLCTASFQLLEDILPTSLAVTTGSTALPPVETQPELEHIVVRATRENENTHWTVNERRCASLVEVRQVLAAVAEIDRTLPVVLDVADDVPLGDMIDVYDLCRLAGFEKIQFAAERPVAKPV